MRGYLKLTAAGLKSFVRDRSGLFWTIFFPLFFIFTFGSIFGNSSNESNVRMGIGVVVPDASQSTQWIAGTFRQVPVFDVVEGSLEEEKKALMAGRRNAVVVFPADYGRLLANRQPAEVRVLTDQSRREMSQAAAGIIRQVLQGVEANLTGQRSFHTLREEAITPGEKQGGFRMIDFVLPGILGMTIMQLGLFTAIPLITMREKGILKRLRATPLSRSAIVGSQVTQRLVIALFQTFMIVGIGVAFYKVAVQGSFAMLVGLVIFGVLTFISLGALLSALARTQESGTAVVQLVNFPMMFLSGVFFPPEIIPPGIRVITNVLPLTYLADALRHTILGSPSLFGIPKDLAVLAIWLAACLVLAARTFRWE